MKKLLASAILLVALTTTSQAQKISLGGKAGASLTKISGMAFKEGYDLGYHLGVFAEIGLSEKLGIQPELVWNQVNTQRASGTDTIWSGWQTNTRDIQLNYLTIPILLKYDLTNLISLNLGPQFGILMNKDESLLNNGKQAFKSGDFSLVGGATINISRFRVYGRYNIGLNDIKDVQNSDSWKNQQIQLGVGVRL